MNETDALTAVLNELKSMKEDINDRFDKVNERLDKMDARFDKMDARFDKMDKRLDKMDARIDNLEQDNKSIKHTCHLAETDLMPKVQVLLETYCDLAKNIMIAKNIDERVSMLEFDVRVIKGLLQTK